MVLEAVCKQETQARGRQYALLMAAQGAINAGGTIGLGKGRFATASGEVWLTYKCRPLVVQAKDDDKCYNFLPVRLSSRD